MKYSQWKYCLDLFWAPCRIYELDPFSFNKNIKIFPIILAAHSRARLVISATHYFGGKLLPWEVIWVRFFFGVNFLFESIFFSFLKFWKKIQIADARKVKRIYCLLCKQWLIGHKVPSYALATKKGHKSPICP